MTRLEGDHVHSSYSLREAQRGGIHAVAEVGWFGAVVEDMAEVGIAFGAGNRGADHAEGCVADFGYVFAGDGCPEAGPSCTRFEFRGGIEQRIVTAKAAVDAFVVQVPVFSRESDFGVGVARDVEGSGTELLAPLVGRLDNLRDLHFFQALAGVGEEHDGDVFGLRERGRGVQNRGAFPAPPGQAPNRRDGGSEKRTALNIRRRCCRALLGRTAGAAVPK
jgi:hypothetical protein